MGSLTEDNIRWGFNVSFVVSLNKWNYMNNESTLVSVTLKTEIGHDAKFVFICGTGSCLHTGPGNVTTSAIM